MATTIQELLAQKPKMQNTQRVEYVETVEAYDRWAEVRCAFSVTSPMNHAT